ncbi:heavy metal translocating P-type ATPase [Alkaliphilus transvaalensis]|uniref:heavy metal translocating P-type ATPase n=1 Tax=Alkaliphilus transvaalensis TaxID=114628 RepID=UPI000AE1E3CD|nr:heavy metal translocating P-type ATPase [Alkaliphilus transvaalensis]
MQVKHRKDLDKNLLLQAIEASGHSGRIISKSSISKENRKEKRPWYQDKKLRLTLASGLIFATAIILGALGIEKNTLVPFYLASIILGGYYIGKSGLNSLKRLSLDMNFLMSVAVIGAAFLGEWSEGAAVVFLFSVGNTLQNYTMDQTRKSIEALMDLAPNEAFLKNGKEEVLVSVDDLKVDDVIIVKPGAKIPIDGTIIKGYTTINQAPITGESIPVEKTIGDEVYAATINQQGLLEVRVTKLVTDTTLAKIMHMVEEAQNKKAPSQQMVDVFAKYYTPIVVIVAMGIATIPSLVFGLEFSEWLKKALILLVISCPCALVISTPVSIVSAIGNASKQGILIKGGAHLEETGRLKAIALDKTGTLTEGKPRVVEVEIIKEEEGINPLALAAALEKGSEHPIAKAVVEQAKEANLNYHLNVENFEALIGKGIKGEINHKTYYLGNRRLFNELKIDLSNLENLIQAYQTTGKTVILMGTDKEIIALFTVADTIRKESKQAILSLKKSGIKNITMLTGDHEATAEAVAKEIGLDSYRAGLMPEDKLKEINLLTEKYGKVAMVGDGINDAPALATANIGIAMGVAGTDTALETADIALMGDDLTKVAYAIDLSRKTLTIIKQNIWFSIFVKAIFMVLTFLGMANLWMAVFADTGAAIIVILNGMRLLKMK